MQLPKIQNPKSKGPAADLVCLEPALPSVMCTEFPQKNKKAGISRALFSREGPGLRFRRTCAGDVLYAEMQGKKKPDLRGANPAWDIRQAELVSVYLQENLNVYFVADNGS